MIKQEIRWSVFRFIDQKMTHYIYWEQIILTCVLELKTSLMALHYPHSNARIVWDHSVTVLVLDTWHNRKYIFIRQPSINYFYG